MLRMKVWFAMVDEFPGVRLVRILVVVSCLICVTSLLSAQTRDLPNLLDVDPEIPEPKLQTMSPETMQQLWLLALDGPEVDVRRRVVESTREALRVGIAGFEAFIPALIRLVENADTQSQLRLASIRALAELDSPSAAGTLMKSLDGADLQIALTVEPTLARWDHGPMREVWLSRLETSNLLRWQLLLAIDALGEVAEARAESGLRRILNEPKQSSEVRWAAAQALARVQPTGLVALSREWSTAGNDSDPFPRLIASVLLAHHEGAEAEELLLRYALDNEPAVADIALQRLMNIAPDQVRALSSRLITHRDANIRRWSIQAIGGKPNVPNVRLLSDRLKDPHPELRVMARDFLLEFAENPQIFGEVVAATVECLEESDWRGLEQASRILAQLDHKPAAPRMVNLLEHERDEVGVTAAWALRVLAVPETLEGALAYTTAVMKVLKTPAFGGARLPDDLDNRLGHLLQFFGAQRYEPADELLRGFFPKEISLEMTRASAMWALGSLHAENPPADLAAALIGRLQDTTSLPPEISLVRQHAAIALGRMKYEEALPTLRERYLLETSNTGVGYASGWAVEQMTGEPVAAPLPETRGLSAWFLVPVRRK